MLAPNELKNQGLETLQFVAGQIINALDLVAILKIQDGRSTMTHYKHSMIFARLKNMDFDIKIMFLLCLDLKLHEYLDIGGHFENMPFSVSSTN